MDVTISIEIQVESCIGLYVPTCTYVDEPCKTRGSVVDNEEEGHGSFVENRETF